MTKRFFELFAQIAVLLFCIVWLCYMMIHNEVPTDTGDGIMHYFISQAAWSDPTLFLHHWGKPFFILLSSPFAQLGFNGVVVFNVLVYGLTVILGYLILNRKGVSIWIAILFPLILLKAHDVASTILGGLTEPLFNLAIIGALFFLLEKKYVWFALIVSLMPFMRSEGQLPFILALGLLLYHRQFTRIPLLLFGFTLYAIAGIFVYDDFWWYFTKSPYAMDNGIYGKGTWLHYLLAYKSYLGNAGLYVLIVSVPFMFYLLLKRKWDELELDWAFFAHGIFFGVLASHSYFWATGQNGSLGLTRIGTQGMPVFVLIHLYYLSRMPIHNTRVFNGILGLACAGLLVALSTTKYFPKKADPLDKEIMNAANYLKKQQLKGNHIYYHFPLFCFAFGENSFIRDQQTVHHSFLNLENDLKHLIQPGDIIVRDSHFGPVEMHFPLDEIAKHPELVKIKEFISVEQLSDPYNETEGVIIYQFVPKKFQYRTELNESKKSLIDHTFSIRSQNEFTDIHELVPSLSTDYKISFNISTSVDGFRLVYDANTGAGYALNDLKSSVELPVSYTFKKGKETKLYIWNPEKKQGKVVLKNITIEKSIDRPLLMD
jgi:hypothetical protein